MWLMMHNDVLEEQATKILRVELTVVTWEALAGGMISDSVWYKFPFGDRRNLE